MFGTEIGCDMYKNLSKQNQMKPYFDTKEVSALDPDIIHLIRYLEKNLQNEVVELKLDTESQEYLACTIQFHQTKIVFRKAKITPKKVGQFVTLWKRNPSGKTEPFSDSDPYSIYIILAKSENKMGYFYFPKEVLLARGILNNKKQKGKLGFRVYPPWDHLTNKQAVTTAIWQRECFVEILFPNSPPSLPSK